MKPISCKEAVEFILKKEEGKLSVWGQLRLWRHLAICSLCRIFSNQSKLINQALRQRKEKQYTLSDDEKEHIIRNVLDGKKD